jgi:hypothetical protein
MSKSSISKKIKQGNFNEVDNYLRNVKYLLNNLFFNRRRIIIVKYIIKKVMKMDMKQLLEHLNQ